MSNCQTCPVCKGTGKKGIDSNLQGYNVRDVKECKCHVCNGKGIINILTGAPPKSAADDLGGTTLIPSLATLKDDCRRYMEDIKQLQLKKYNYPPESLTENKTEKSAGNKALEEFIKSIKLNNYIL